MKKEEKKPVYIMCPRCELNYINKKDKYCTVCKAELGLVDPSILIPDEEEIGVEKLCPICHVNYIGEDEEICFLCQKEQAEKDASPENEDEWKELNSDHRSDSPDEIGLPLVDDEIFVGADDEPEEEEEEEVAPIEPDDFDYTANPEDFEEDDEDEEEEDEDEDEDLF